MTDGTDAASRREHQRAGGKTRHRQTTATNNKVGVETSDWPRGSSLMRDRHASTDSGKVRREPGTDYQL